MHFAFFTAHAAQEFGRAVGQHFVHVHVALGARSRLPDRQGKFIGPFAGDDLVGRADDAVGDGRVQLAEFGVDLGGRALQAGHRVDQRHRHLFGGNREKMQRTLRLSAPEVILGDFDGPKRVFFDAGLHGAYNSVAAVSRKRRCPPEATY
ncbi:hypothetical protein D3C72_1264370 [compost metagenome]